MPGNHIKSLIRPMRKADNTELARIIRATLTEFGADKPGTVFFDASTDNLYNYFQKNKSAYYIAELNNQIMGGGGIYPSESLPSDTCELVKMYLLPQARNLGIGKQLIEHCLEAARREGFSRVYLETMPELKLALKVYEKFGFNYLSQPLGSNAHFGCNLWMSMNLH